MSAFGSASNSNGQFWYGSQTNFPGFLYKKNVGVGGRRSTKFGAGGNTTCNTYQYLYNKYKPGQGGVGASSIAVRRAKNRQATICINNNCFPCYMSLGQYSNYTHNPNGFYSCLTIPITPTPTYYQTNAYFATFRGNYPMFYGRSLSNGPTNLNFKFQTQNPFHSPSIYSSCVIDKNGFIYVCSSPNSGLICYYPNCEIKWYYLVNNNNGTPRSIPIIGYDGTIYFTCNISPSTGKLFAINPNGSLKWSSDILEGNVDSTLPIIVSNNNLIVGTEQGNIYKINKNGKILYTFNFPSDNFNGHSLSYNETNNSVYINSSVAPNYKLFRIDLTNNTFISVNIGSYARFSIPIVIDNSVYQSTSNYVFKYDANTLALEAQFNLNGDGSYNCFTVGINKNIFISTTTGNFYKLDSKDLTQLGSINLGVSSYASSSILSYNNLIYILVNYSSITSTLYCIDPNTLSIVTNQSFINNLPTNFNTPAIGSNNNIYLIIPTGLNVGLAAIGN